MSFWDDFIKENNSMIPKEKDYFKPKRKSPIVKRKKLNQKT